MQALKHKNLRWQWLAAFLASIPLASSATSPAPPPRTLVNQYCVACHNQKTSTAGIALDSVDPSKVGDNAAVWEKVFRKVSSGQMPPAGLPHPTPAVSAAFSKWLEEELDHAAAVHPNPGRPTVHRLNRAEYSNAVRDLLALDIQPGSKLPNDDTGYGFDNIGDVLSLSPVLIERYMSVARMVSRFAIGITSGKPEVNEFEPVREPRNLAGARNTRNQRVSDDLPFDSSGGMSIDYHFPVDGEYEIKIKMPPAPGASFGDLPPEPRYFGLRLPVKAGTRHVGVTFLGDNTLPEVAGVGGGRRGAGPQAPTQVAKLDLRLDGARVKLYDVSVAGTPVLTSVMIAGPYKVDGPGESASRQRIFVCKPATAKDEDPCARKIIATLGRRAYRRPFTDADLKPLFAFYQAGRREGSFDLGIERALRAMLVSPDFLFRIERDPAGSVPGSVYRINDLELASRLSFFLWSSIPDEELLHLAEQGKLKDPEVIAAQVTRMLEDRRSKAFVSNFAGQWLYLRNLAQIRPDQDVFPEFDSTLRQSFQRETELFFDAILRENRPVTDLLSANFTFLNQRLAEHYGIPNVYGPQFRRVTLDDPSRGGLLGQGSILTVTSYPNRTSVVQRGKWVLENLLGTPPPPPPPDVPPLEAHAKDGRELTMRQQMEQHRANPTCAGCHSRMDPIGFALENYNGVGAWRSKDAGSVIDASGKLPDGTKFEGPAGLRNILLTGHRDEFIDTITEKLLTYALGRGLEYYDRPAIRAIMRDAAQKNTTLPALINSIVKSPQFQMRKTRES